MNSTSSSSTHITRRQLADLIDAATFAWRNDMPLMRFLTFNLKRSEIRPQKFVSKFIKLVGDWLRTQGVPLAYLWVLEHPPGKSLNLHLLIHVPDHLSAAFARKERSWLQRAGLKWRPSVLQSQKLGPSKRKGQAPLSDAEYSIHLETLLSYFMKGGDPDCCQALHLDHAKQGTIYGKRVSISESIGRKARSESGYVPPPSPRFAFIFDWRCRLDWPLAEMIKVIKPQSGHDAAKSHKFGE